MVYFFLHDLGNNRNVVAGGQVHLRAGGGLARGADGKCLPVPGLGGHQHGDVVNGISCHNGKGVHTLLKSKKCEKFDQPSSYSFHRSYSYMISFFAYLQDVINIDCEDI